MVCPTTTWRMSTCKSERHVMSNTTSDGVTWIRSHILSDKRKICLWTLDPRGGSHLSRKMIGRKVEGEEAAQVVLVLKGAQDSPGSPKTVIFHDGKSFIRREMPMEALTPTSGQPSSR